MVKAVVLLSSCLGEAGGAGEHMVKGVENDCVITPSEDLSKVVNCSSGKWQSSPLSRHSHLSMNKVIKIVDVW